jgi:nucleoside 2-deoxyribosyltransferase
MNRIYLAGPMTGLPDFNYPAFNAEAARLRALGYHVENPSENPDQPSWAHYMRQALAQLVTCDTIAVLPGWRDSRGARLEVTVANALGMPVVIAAEITAPAEVAA